MTDPKERPEATNDTGTAAGGGNESGGDQQNHPLTDAETGGVVGGAGVPNSRLLPSGATVDPADIAVDQSFLNLTQKAPGSSE